MNKKIKLIVTGLFFLFGLILPMPTNNNYIKNILKKPKEKNIIK